MLQNDQDVLAWFFENHSPSECERILVAFRDLIERDVSGIYEWRQGKLREQIPIAGWAAPAKL